MSDQHASASFKLNAPRGTRHSRPDWSYLERMDETTLARLLADPNTPKVTRRRIRKLRREASANPEGVNRPDPTVTSPSPNPPSPERSPTP